LTKKVLFASLQVFFASRHVYDYLIKIGHPVDENGNIIGTTNYTAFIGVKDTILYMYRIPLI
jgi:hypothetical protein